MKKNDENELKLIFVLKIGTNSKGEGMYEFLFSKDPENLSIKDWNWDISPAIDNKEYLVPDSDYIDKIYSLTTKQFELFCLHDATDRPYIHGYHLIMALAYEYENEEEGYKAFDNVGYDYEEELDDTPLLVFHYGNTLQQIKDKLYERNIILKGDKFINPSKTNIKTDW